MYGLQVCPFGWAGALSGFEGVKPKTSGTADTARDASLDLGCAEDGFEPGPLKNEGSPLDEAQ